MKITKRQLSLIIENYLLTEAVHDKVAAQLEITDPDKIEQLRIASEKPHKLQKPELMWIGKYFKTPEGMQTKEPIADIVGAIKSLKQNKSALIRRGSDTDLSNYESPGQINIAVSLSQGFVALDQLSEQVDVLYEDENWTLYMPHSREASCTIGRGTTWCTAIPGAGNNLFYNYVISGRAILYYLVKKKKEENEGPATTHFSLGTMNGKIPFPEEGKGHGTIVVDGSNKGLSRQRFLAQVGNQLGEQLITAIEKHSQSNNNKHPAKKKIIEMLKNPLLYAVEVRGKSIDVIYDFTSMVLSAYDGFLSHHYGLHGEERVSDEEEKLIFDLFMNPNNPSNKAIVAATEVKQKDITAYETGIQSNNDEIIQKYGKIFADGNAIQDVEHTIRRNAKDPSLGDTGYRFCKNLNKLSGAVPYYFYISTEKMGQNRADGWKDAELYDFYPGFEVIDCDEQVSPEVEYFIDDDPAVNGADENLNKHFSNFIEMLRVYHANVLISNGYCLVHDPQYHSGQRDDFAGMPVVYLETYMSTNHTEMYWADDRYPVYEHAPFTSNEIQDYMQKRYPQEFIDWCNMHGFTFTYE